uniref:Uncharacterized protein n=1 Tax=Cacopsylla melanoneura TaxID=428564 RepID=A0A8D9E2E6_9HEMI
MYFTFTCTSVHLLFITCTGIKYLYWNPNTCHNTGCDHRQMYLFSYHGGCLLPQISIIFIFEHFDVFMPNTYAFGATLFANKIIFCNTLRKKDPISSIDYSSIN